MFPQVMGFLVFLAGLVMLVVSVLDTIIPVGLGPVERFVMFGAGTVTCVLGYFMATSVRSR